MLWQDRASAVSGQQCEQCIGLGEGGGGGGGRGGGAAGRHYGGLQLIPKHFISHSGFIRLCFAASKIETRERERERKKTGGVGGGGGGGGGGDGWVW